LYDGAGRRSAGMRDELRDGWGFASRGLSGAEASKNDRSRRIREQRACVIREEVSGGLHEEIEKNPGND
jgi:hypothetical protein